MKKKYFKKINNKFIRYRLYTNPRFYRPTSKPFISGDSLRKMSDHIFDETKTLNPNKVKKNDIVFVKGDLLKYYFENYHPFVKSKYILISHNSDESVDKTLTKFIDENIIHWFCCNLVEETSEHITPIPIGLENMRYRNNGNINFFLETLKVNEKKKGVLSSFNVNTNFDKRNDIMKISEEIEYINVRTFSHGVDYLNNLNKFQFNLCPEGNGKDTHRVWESLIFGVTPIVLKSTTNLNFYKIGVPMIMLESWENLYNLTLEDIKLLNLENNNKNFKDFALYDYWKNLVISKKLI